MKAKSIKGKSPEEIQTKLEEAMSDSFSPTIAMVFSSITQDRKSICDILDVKGISIFGATSLGEFIDGEKGINSTAIMLLDMEKSHFQIILEDSGFGKEREDARFIGQKGKEKFENPAFFLCGSNMQADGEEITKGIVDACGSDVSIYGGMAGSEIEVWGDSFVFTNEKESSFGIIALVFDKDKYEIISKASCGWQGAGTIKTVTKSDGIWIHSIDNKPALDLMFQFTGIEHQILNRTRDPLADIASDFPLQIVRENGSTVMRAPMFGNWDNNSFCCAGTVTEGSKLRFTLPGDFDVIQNVISEVEEIQKANPMQPDALIIFSCFARLVAFGPLLDTENQGIKDIWGAPMAGFFTLGEFGRATNGDQEFHNITCSWVALKEK